MAIEKNLRDLESGIHIDLSGRMSYGGYLQLPTLLSAAEAARRIVRGFAGGRFEIHFPRRFTLMLKLLRCLPYRIYFRVAARSGVRRSDG